MIDLESILNSDGAGGVATSDSSSMGSIRDVIIQTMAIEGCVRVGDTLDLGLHAAGGGSVVSITFTENMLARAKDGITLRHLNLNKRDVNAYTKVHVAGWENGQKRVTDSFVDVLLPRDCAQVKMPQTMCGQVKSVGDAIAENQSLHLCGCLAPPHLRRYMAYGAIEITVNFENTSFTFYVSCRTPDPVADAIYYTGLTDCDSSEWYLLGRLSDDSEAHLSIDWLFANRFCGNEFDLIRSADPLSEDTQNAKRVLSATDVSASDDDGSSPAKKRCV